MGIKVNNNLLTKSSDLDALKALCPFKAIVDNDKGELEINAGCKACMVCVKKGEGIFVEEKIVKLIDKSQWKGISVYIDCVEGEIHPVSLELIGKARELAKKINEPVYALFIGSDITEQAKELLHYGVDKIFIYDDKDLKHFNVEPYTNIFENFIKEVKPSSILVGATVIGRSLTPRVAARVMTGVTADCTILDVKDNSDLIQIRPAFGGNIMAQITTPNHRPQMATVRYKVFDAPKRSAEKAGELVLCAVKKEWLKSRIKVLSVEKKLQTQSISDAEVIVAFGRGVKTQKDVDMIKNFAEKIGGEIAITRPIAEAGWVENGRQIGLSGRTVKPKLIFTTGISGSIQFKAGMQSSDLIISINEDKSALIFDVAHHGIVGNLYEIMPKLLEKLNY